MAEFDEVVKQLGRICASNFGECDICDLRPFCPSKTFLDKYAKSGRAERLEEMATKWATEHPEPVYPTWLEYLARYCGAPCKIDFSPIQFAEEVHGVLPETYIHWLMTHRIPADIAQRLGIEPKEGV